MPTYQYRCAKCGDQFEEWQSIHDEPLKRHRGGCGGKLDKVLSVGGIVLKGSGFYKTDNRSTAKSGRSEAAKADGSSDSTSDSSREKSSSNGSGGDTKTSTSKESKSAAASASGPSKSGASTT